MCVRCKSTDPVCPEMVGASFAGVARSAETPSVIWGTFDRLDVSRAQLSFDDGFRRLSERLNAALWSRPNALGRFSLPADEE